MYRSDDRHSATDVETCEAGGIAFGEPALTARSLEQILPFYAQVNKYLLLLRIVLAEVFKAEASQFMNGLRHAAL